MYLGLRGKKWYTKCPSWWSFGLKWYRRTFISKARRAKKFNEARNTKYDRSNSLWALSVSTRPDLKEILSIDANAPMRARRYLGKFLYFIYIYILEKSKTSLNQNTFPGFTNYGFQKYTARIGNFPRYKEGSSFSAKLFKKLHSQNVK